MTTDVVGSSPRRRFALVASAALLIAGLALGNFAPGSSDASSHREAPLISADPQVDNTDTYAFVSPDAPDTVTLISNFIPFEEPAGGPNFYPFAGQKSGRYSIKVDNDHDAREDLTFRFEFTNRRRSGDTFLYNTGPVNSLTDTTLNVFQTYDVTLIDSSGKKTKKEKLVDDAIAVPSNVGEASMPDYAALREEGIVDMDGGGSAFAGQADDSFFLDLRVFDLLYGADFSEIGDDTLAGFNVNTLALQVPKEMLADGDADDNPIIGVWSIASRKGLQVDNKKQRVSRDSRQVSRLGMPLVNEVVIPLKDKDRWNRSQPRGDAKFLEYIVDPELPKLIEAIYGPATGLEAPEPPRDDLIAVFLTGVGGLNKPDDVRPSEMLRLNMSIPPCEPPACTKYSRLGVIGGDIAGYPNGRRLADDTIDISLQVVMGELVGQPNDLGDAVDANDYDFGDSFPYVSLPTAGSDAAPHN
ncbi:MAG: DUF4331 domain-containing protein [Actinomycetota bacterium]